MAVAWWDGLDFGRDDHMGRRGSEATFPLRLLLPQAIVEPLASGAGGEDGVGFSPRRARAG